MAKGWPTRYLAWSEKQGAVFSAHKEYELAQLLVNADEKVVRMGGDAPALCLCLQKVACATTCCFSSCCSSEGYSSCCSSTREATTKEAAAAAAPARCPRKRTRRGQLERKLRAAAARTLQGRPQGLSSNVGTVLEQLF